MKTFGKLGTVFTMLVLFASCNFTEEIYLNADGSGRMSINFDGSEFMEMAGDGLLGTKEEDLDSIISFKHLLEERKDSIATLPLAEQEKLKQLEPFNLHMVVNAEQKAMRVSMYRDFGLIAEVNDAFNAFQNVNALDPKGAAPSGFMGVDGESTEVDYTFTGNSFRRDTRITDPALHQSKVDSLKSSEMFLAGSTYTFKYHFPRRIKKVNVEGATFSMDGKTMIYEVNFLEMMRSPETMSIAVELEHR